MFSVVVEHMLSDRIWKTDKVTVGFLCPFIISRKNPAIIIVNVRTECQKLGGRIAVGTVLRLIV